MLHVISLRPSFYCATLFLTVYNNIFMQPISTMRATSTNKNAYQGPSKRRRNRVTNTSEFPSYLPKEICVLNLLLNCLRPAEDKHRFVSSMELAPFFLLTSLSKSWYHRRFQLAPYNALLRVKASLKV
jgi:hypothetical protein